MANLFVNLPLPVLNGPGAAVSTAGMGADKTVTVAGDFPGATITVEISHGGGGIAGEWAPLYAFQTGDRPRVFTCAASEMRVTVSGRKASVAFGANIDVAASDMGGLFVAIPMPAGNGAGAPVDTSALGSLNTIIVGGSFAGATIVIEESGDGVDYAPVATFAGYGGQISKVLTSNWLRANVTGRKSTVAFSGAATAGAVNDPDQPGAGHRFSPPEKWTQNDIAADQVDVALETLVSVNFADIKMIRAGSVVGLGTRLTEAITAGTLTVTITVNGVGGTLAVVHTAGSNPSGGEATQADGIDTFVAGDLIGMQITTTVGFLPVTTDLEAWLEIQESDP